MMKLETLVGWLESQPPEQSYAFCTTTSCLLAQYFRAQGADVYSLGTRNFISTPDRHGYATEVEFPRVFNEVANGMDSQTKYSAAERTMGAAARRARGALEGYWSRATGFTGSGPTINVKQEEAHA